jgi:hypothetical protein
MVHFSYFNKERFMNKLALALFASLMLVAPACHKKDKTVKAPKKEHKMKKEKKGKMPKETKTHKVHEKKAA